MDNSVINQLKAGGIGVIPTDTIYGVVGSALNPGTVERIYKLRKRATDKQFIILISKLSDLKKFNVSLIMKQIKFLKKIWPNPVSVVLPRGKKSLAFRMPRDKWLINLLKKVGPLVAPSANPAGKKPAETINEAKKYFEERVDFYVDGGKIKSKPSTLIQLNDDCSFNMLRQGNYKV